MKCKCILLLILFGFALSTHTYAQSLPEKNEVEDSINRTDMPERALSTLDEIWPDLKGARYYAQTDGDTESFEVKLEWQGRDYSIEFTKEGFIIDVEVLIREDEISTSAKQGIDNFLSEQFQRFRLTRLQRQFIANDEDGIDDVDFIDDILEGDEEDYLVYYELEVEGKSGSDIGAFELLFDDGGILIQRRKIVRRSIDNIW